MEVSRDSTSNKAIRRLLPFFTAHRKLLWLIWLAALLAACLDVLYPYLLNTMTDAVLAEQNERFKQLIVWASGAMAIDVALRYVNRLVSIRYQTYTIRDLRNRVTAHLQQLPISYLETLHSGDLVSRLNSDLDKLGGLSQRIHDLVQQPVIFLLGFTYLYDLSWKLLLATCILIPVSAILHDKVVRPMQAHSRKEMEHLARANAVTQDAIRGIYIIKAFNLQKLLTRKYQRIAEDVRKEGLAIDRRAAIEVAVFLMLRYIPQLVAPLYGGYLAFTGEITPGALMACTYLIWMVFLPVETALGWIRQLREVTPAAERVLEILDHPMEDGHHNNLKPVSGAPPISFNSVGFSYQNDSTVLHDFNLDVEGGSVVALVGPSGCGKSTVLKLLCGFYRPQKGTIKLNGSDILQTDIRGVRRFVSLVSQETYLFPTSISENIGYGRFNAGQEDIITAAKAANAHDFIEALPEGYETHAGEWGSRLSGGERQRIALARAILKDAPVLLLDEPTSALDAHAEEIVQEALDRFMQGRTVLIVAHRLSTIRNADEIVVLHDGHLHEHGTHEQLMQSDSMYKRLYLKQTALEEGDGQAVSRT